MSMKETKFNSSHKGYRMAEDGEFSSVLIDSLIFGVDPGNKGGL